MASSRFSGVFLDVDADEIEDILEEPEDDFDTLVQVCQRTIYNRARLRDQWDSIWHRAKKDPEQIWLDLCQPGPRQYEAVKLCKKFLRIYATARKRRAANLGLSEYAVRQSVRSATTLMGYWRALVSEFNQTVLAKKRKEDPHNKSQWSLKVMTGLNVFVKHGPIFEVTSWIKGKAGELGLTREQTFVKAEATPVDIAVLLKTIWMRAADIPCDPVTRIAFHSMVLLGGIAGFRPGMIVDVKYCQVALYVVLDPHTKETRLAAKFTVRQNKTRVNTVRTNQANILDLTIAMTKSSLFDIVSLVVARALADDAFDIPVDSLQTLISRPVFETTQRLKVGWKADILDRPIFPIKYNTYCRLWKQTNLVAGHAQPLRPYSLRVGAANRLDGVLSSALRNYIVGHSSGTYVYSYQARHIKQNLMPILDETAADDTELFQLLRNSSIDWDSQAPIYVTPSDIEKWEQTRDDLRICREKGDKVRHATIIRKLSQLLVEQRRQEYFQESNKLRISGKSAANLAKPHENPSRRKAWYGDSTPLAHAVASILTRNEPCSIEDSVSYVEKLVAYQTVARRRPSPSSSDGESIELKQPACKKKGFDGSETGTKKSTTPTHLWKARCLLCSDAKTSKDLSALREHYDKVHKDMWDKPFSCPRCDETAAIDGWNNWVTHIESHHGLENAPKRRPIVAVTCLLCPESSFQSKQGLSIHTSRCNHSEFHTPSPCPECRRHPMAEGAEAPLISNLSEWCSHVALSHGGPDQAPTPPTTLFSCLFCAQEIANEANHYLRKHSNVFDGPFACPACLRQGANEVPFIDNRNAWQVHCAAAHGKTEVVFGQNAHELARCLVCDEMFSKVADHFTKSHLQSMPFSCPECEKRGVPEQQIQDRDGWILRCAEFHNDISAALASRTASFHSKRKRKSEDDSSWERKVKRERTSV